MNLYHQMYKAKAIHLKEMISNVNMIDLHESHVVILQNQIHFATIYMGILYVVSHLTTTPQGDHL